MIYVINIINNVNGVSDLVVIWSYKICDIYMVMGGIGFCNRIFFLYLYICIW